MRCASFVRAILTICVIGTFAASGNAQLVADARGAAAPSQPAIGASEAVPKFTFYLFWRDNDATTQQMSAALQEAIAKRGGRAEMTAVNVTDPASRPTIDRFQVSRMPLPAAICVAPNGAVTGAFVRKINDEAVEGSLISPAAAAVVKAIQDKKIAVILIAPSAQTELPAGAAQFVADPAFAARSIVIPVVASSPEESRLLASMQVDARSVVEPMTIVIAPPGALVGKFPASATASQIGTALHAAGKCCNDPNCKHNQQGAQQ